MRKLKTALFTGISGIAIAGMITGANAADVYQPEPVAEPLPVPVAFDWTRFYVGLNAGYAFGDYDSDLGSVVAPLAVPNNIGGADGFVGGVQAGYNYQFNNNFVAGIEGEINYADVDDNFTVAAVGGNITGDAELEYFGTITGRLGFLATPGTLVYGKGGYAFGHVDVDVDQTAIGGGTASDSNFHHGWTVGAGVEQVVFDNVTLKVEYNYVDLGQEDFNVGLATPVEADLDTHVVRAGVNFHF